MISKLFRKRTNSYFENTKMKPLFFKVVELFKEEYVWEKISAYTQESKPKYKFSIYDNFSTLPSITVNPFKNHIQIRIKYNKDIKSIESLRKYGFVDTIYNNKNGEGVLYLTFNVKNQTDLQKLKGLKIDHYFNVKTNKNDDTDAHYIEDLNSNSSINKDVVVKARVGQGRFRKRLIEHWGQCQITKCDQTSLLRASHIKPWKDCLDGEHLDPYNGLLLTAHYDVLFDSGLISFDDNGKILISSTLSIRNIRALKLNQKAKLELSEPHFKYMNFHRSKVFIK